MAKISERHAGTAEGGPPQPPHLAQPVGSLGGAHAQDLGDVPAAEAADVVDVHAKPCTASDVGRSGQVDAEDAQIPGTRANGADGMASLGGRSSAGDSPASLPRRYKRRVTTPEGGVNRQAIIVLLERQQYRCALSGRALTPETASLDHKFAVSRGGEHRIENVQVLHKDVNRAKGTLTNQEFVALCGEVWCRAQAKQSRKESA